MGVHSLLSPSSAYRWLECQGCIELLLNHKVNENSTSQHAERGSKIHEYAATILSSIDTMIAYSKLMQATGNNEDKIAIEEAKNYVDYVNSFYNKNDIINIEKDVPLYDIYPNTKGTVDSYIIKKDRNELHVFDLKTGYIKVSSENNPQLMLYAYGILQLHSYIDIDLIYLHIIQDNDKLFNTNYYAISKTKLLEFISKVKEIAKKISINEFEYKEGSHCKYCPVSQYCYKIKESISKVCNDINTASDDIDNLSRIVYEYTKYESIIEKYKQIIKDYLIQGGENELYDIQYRKGKSNAYTIPDHELFMHLLEKYPIIENHIKLSPDVDSFVNIKLAPPAKIKKELYNQYQYDKIELDTIMNDIQNYITPDDEVEKIPILYKKKTKST